MENFNPLPIIAQTSVDAQQIELIHQVQKHMLSPLQAALLGYLLTFQPLQWFLSLETRLNIYYTLAPILGSLPIPPLLAAAFILTWPVWVLVFIVACFYVIKTILNLIHLLAPNLFKKYIPVEEKVFLEVTFPSDTSKSAYATSQLYTLLHTLSRRGRPFIQRFLGQKKTYSLEIVATKEQGIRYILGTNAKDSQIFKSSLLSYLPGVKVKEIKDYLPNDPTGLGEFCYGLTELKLHSHFALPLNKQKVLDEHDPISYLTGNMTKLSSGELISFQVVTTPILDSVHGTDVKSMTELRRRIVQGKPLTPILNKSALDKFLEFPVVVVVWFFTKISFQFLGFLVWFVVDMIFSVGEGNKSKTVVVPSDMFDHHVKPQEILNPYEQEL